MVFCSFFSKDFLIPFKEFHKLDFFSSYSMFLFPQLEKLMMKNYYLHRSGQEAYKGYVRAYDSHSLKQIFDISTLDLQKVAKSFGFKVPPGVDLSILSKYIFKIKINCIQFFRLWLYRSPLTACKGINTYCLVYEIEITVVYVHACLADKIQPSVVP